MAIQWIGAAIAGACIAAAAPAVAASGEAAASPSAPNTSRQVVIHTSGLPLRKSSRPLMLDQPASPDVFLSLIHI